VLGRKTIWVAMTDRELLLEINAKLDQLLSLRQHNTPAIPNIAAHLRAIATHADGAKFYTSDLVELANMPDYSELRSAIISLCGAVNAKKLAKFLNKIEGNPIGGLRIERVGHDREGVLWILRDCGI
jgi:hypothetical protein